MLLTPANLAFVFYGLDTRFKQGLQKAEPWSEKIATTVPSTTEENRYAWVGAIPKMREWIGERQLRNLEARGYVLPNKDYEASLEIPRNKIEDDQFGIYGNSAEGLGWAAKVWPDDLVIAALKAGTTALCFDGQPFFNASHPVKFGDSSMGTFSNNLTGTALTAPNFAAARAAMMAYKDENGDALRINPRLLVVPPALEATARQILQAENIAPAGAFGQNAAGGFQTNVMKGTADLHVAQELAGQDTTWYLMDVSKPIKPLVFQKRKDPQFASLTDPTAENVFKRKTFIYGVDARGNAGYTLPHLCLRAIA